MTYTADFHPRKRRGDMFQFINGDVWIVATNYPGNRATVVRVAQYDPTWIAPRTPRPACFYCGHGFTRRNPDASPRAKQYHLVCLQHAEALEREAQIELSKGTS